MNIEYKDFVAVYYNVYPEGYCEHLINEFERLTNSGAGRTRKISENASRHDKDDLHMEINVNKQTFSNFNQVQPSRIFFDGLQQCFNEYSEHYSIIKHGKVRATAMKMQRTSPGGGYHLWHCEQGESENSSRVLVYMLYLNTLSEEEAGETEFLYQQRRIRPTENTMVLWPAAFTHAHRGNTVFGAHSKYIITGWFHYE